MAWHSRRSLGFSGQGLWMGRWTGRRMGMMGPQVDLAFGPGQRHGRFNLSSWARVGHGPWLHVLRTEQNGAQRPFLFNRVYSPSLAVADSAPVQRAECWLYCPPYLVHILASLAPHQHLVDCFYSGPGFDPTGLVSTQLRMWLRACADLSRVPLTQDNGEPEAEREREGNKGEREWKRRHTRAEKGGRS